MYQLSVLITVPGDYQKKIAPTYLLYFEVINAVYLLENSSHDIENDIDYFPSNCESGLSN